MKTKKERSDGIGPGRLGGISSFHVHRKGVQAQAGNRRRLSLLQKVLGETFPALPSLLDQSMIQCLVLCIVDTVVLVVLSAGEQNVLPVGRHVLHLQAF